MSTLHTVNKSPFAQQTLTSCINICRAGDALLLIEDGVYGALPSSPTAEALKALADEGNVHLFALEPDLQARGLNDRISDWITVVDYSGFVQLSTEHQTVQSWY